MTVLKHKAQNLSQMGQKFTCTLEKPMQLWQQSFSKSSFPGAQNRSTNPYSLLSTALSPWPPVSSLLISSVCTPRDTPMGEPCGISWIYAFSYFHYLSGLGMEEDSASKNPADSQNTGTDTGPPHQPSNIAASPKSPLWQLFTYCYLLFNIPYKQILFLPSEVT